MSHVVTVQWAQCGSYFPWKVAVDLTHCLLRKISHRKDKCKTGRTSKSHSGGWRQRLPWVAVMENNLNTDCFIVGLPHSPTGNLQRGNLCNSEIICIILSGVMSCHTVLTRTAFSQLRGCYCLRGGRTLAQFVWDWICVLGLSCCLPAPGSCFQGSIMLSITFSS